MGWKENKIAYIKKYNKKVYKVFCFRFNKSTDHDLIEKLNSVENRQKYIRDLIIADIQKGE